MSPVMIWQQMFWPLKVGAVFTNSTCAVYLSDLNLILEKAA